MSTKEEIDLEKLMGEAGTSISNAEQFVEELAKDLSVLDVVCGQTSVILEEHSFVIDSV